MRYLALATDYDGTLASNDKVAEQTIHALERMKISGRRVILVTGRRLDDLLSVCSCPQLFDSVVAENGAIIYNTVAIFPCGREVGNLLDCWRCIGYRYCALTALQEGVIVFRIANTNHLMPGKAQFA